ncbi:MAG TPA: hypothetical protein G4O11_02405 [Anaerolineae bacterium]|nr:hypothetical protein [Anaerolineae bacterium]
MAVGLTLQNQNIYVKEFSNFEFEEQRSGSGIKVTRAAGLDETVPVPNTYNCQICRGNSPFVPRTAEKNTRYLQPTDRPSHPGGLGPFAPRRRGRLVPMGQDHLPRVGAIHELPLRSQL